MQVAPEVVEITLPFWRKHRGTLLFWLLFGGYFSFRLFPEYVAIAAGQVQAGGLYLAMHAVLLAAVLGALLNLVRKMRADLDDRSADVRVDAAGLQLRDKAGRPHAIGWHEVRYIDRMSGVVSHDHTAAAKGWRELPLTLPQMNAAELDRIWAVIRQYWPILDETRKHQLVKRQHLDFAAAAPTSGADPKL